MREEPPTRSRVAWPTVVPLDDGIELRQWRAALVEQLSAAVEANVEHLRGWMPWIADEPVSIPDRRRLLTLWESAWEAGTDHHYGIFDGDTAVGSVGVMDRLGPGRREIGYWLARAYTGRGIVTGAVRELTTVALSEPGVTRVEIHHDRDNQPSAGIPRRLGFELIDEIATPVVAPAESGVSWIWEMTEARWSGRAPAPAP